MSSSPANARKNDPMCTLEMIKKFGLVNEISSTTQINRGAMGRWGDGEMERKEGTS